jgi:hypothetical protein
MRDINDINKGTKLRLTNPFVISLLGLAVLAAMALWKGVDTSGSVVTLVGAYVGFESARRASHVIAAAKDPSADTAEVIKSVEGK